MNPFRANKLQKDAEQFKKALKFFAILFFSANEEDEENTTLKADEKQSGNEEEQDVTIENMEQEEHGLCNISGEIII